MILRDGLFETVAPFLSGGTTPHRSTAASIANQGHCKNSLAPDYSRSVPIYRADHPN
jgi:hypothetical protein